MTQTSREKIRERAVERCREMGVLIPTLAELRDPQTIDPAILDALPGIDMQAVDPLNLFRITWRNDPRTGSFGPVNALEFPPELTGVEARIVGIVGKHFPTGAHKVGAAFGCLAPRLVNGEFDPTTQRAVWPSTGNYCRGGVFDAALLGCKSLAILPEGMSRERFRWLKKMKAEILATPGTESNVKEIFDACWEIRASRPDAVIFNQFEEFGNYLWHYGVTGPAAESAFRGLTPVDPGAGSAPPDPLGSGPRYIQPKPKFAGPAHVVWRHAGPRHPELRLAAWVGATGSSGTLAAGDYLKENFPGCVTVAAEALECPTLLECGFGGHRIEGIGDKHVPWIHNVRNTDMVTAIDDEATIRILRLFNTAAGKSVLAAYGIADDVIERLSLLGISGVCNLLAAIKTAHYYQLEANDVVLMPLTDSVELYRTRLSELRNERGTMTKTGAVVNFERYLLATSVDYLKELRFTDRRAIHNLKYFTWVEQQNKTAEELDALWSPYFWQDLVAQLPEWDERIAQFNRDTGVLDQIRSRQTAIEPA
ncbi:MAG: pyridoxal-5-phosphate-dependent protein subunit beta [bacterium]|nr:pyridoxal-5-phosphate-dependent protein subunit beta [bacterium]